MNFLRFLNISFLIIAACFATSQVHGQQINVYLVGGQSNADGRAEVNSLPASLQQPQDDIPFYFRTENTLGALTTLRPGLSETSEFGPAITFGRSLADFFGTTQDTSVAIIKYANGGTDLAVDWVAGGTNGTVGDGVDYVLFQETVDAGLVAIADANPNATINIAGMIWMQGESDTVNATIANAYEANLTTFIDDVRQTYAADLDFVIGQLSANQTALNSTNLAIVRDAQASVAANDPNSFLVETDSFELQSDNLHFNADGQQDFGNAFAAQFQSVPTDPTGQIVVESFLSQGFGTLNAVDLNSPWTVPAFDAGAGDKLVVSVSIEGSSVGADFTVTFGGTALTQIVNSNDASNVESTAIFFLDGVSGVGDVVVDAGPLGGNGPAVYIASLSGAEPGFETVGTFGDGEVINGTLEGTLEGVSAGAYTIAHFADQGNPGDIIVTGDLLEVGVFNGVNGEVIGSAVAATATGFGTGADLTVGFSDNGIDTPFQSRSNFSFASFAATPGSPVLLGDVDMNGVVDFFDIQPFIDVLSGGGFQSEADIDGNGAVNFFDIAPFIDILANS